MASAAPDAPLAAATIEPDETMERAAAITLSVTLALWLALAAVGGIAAMAVFPAAKELPLSMDGYAAFTAAEPLLGRQLIAGHLVERVFIQSEIPRLVFAALATAAFVAQLRLGGPAAFRRLRIAALAVAVVALLASAFWARPAFTAVDRKYRALADQVETKPEWVAMAVEHKSIAVDPAHAFASRVATTEIVALLALIALSAGAAAGTTRRA